MLDTLALQLEDYSLEPDCMLLVQPGAYEAATGEKEKEYLLWSKDGKNHYGKYAKHNTKSFQTSLRPHPREGYHEVDLSIKCSVPIVVCGDNVKPADFETTERCFVLMERYLDEIGVKCNIQNALLSRTDATKRIQTKERFQCYHPLLRTMKGTRMDRSDYPEGMMWRNGAQSIIAYNKNVEMQRKKLNAAQVPANTQTFELQLKKAQKIQTAGELRTVADLMQNFDHLKKVYRSTLKKQLFNTQFSQLQLSSVEGVKNEIEYFIHSGEPRPFHSWMNAVALQRGIDDYDVAMQAIDELAPTRERKKQWRDKLQKARVDALKLQAISPSRRPIGELYEELEKKLLK
jgi:hypothetical protein